MDLVNRALVPILNEIGEMVLKISPTNDLS